MREELAELRARAGARDREIDLLEWELEEIDRAGPDADEEESLLGERERLRHLEALQSAAAGGTAALGEETTAALSGAAHALEVVRGVDPALDALAERASALVVEADDLASELRRYGESIEAPPGRLDEVEERLGLLDRLKRKHGGTIAAVLAHAEECRRRREELAGAEEALEAGEARLEAARAALAAQAEALRAARIAAAEALAGAVVERLEGLAMEGATFEARVTPREGYGPSGGDEVEFLIAPNPGVPAGPLRETASGGELSRVMLALMGIAAETGPGDARVRRGRRRHRRADRPGGRRAAARSRRRPPGHLHHPPAADRLARRSPLHDRQGHVGRHRADDGHAARARRRGGRARTHAGRGGW